MLLTSIRRIAVVAGLTAVAPLCAAAQSAGHPDKQVRKAPVAGQPGPAAGAPVGGAVAPPPQVAAPQAAAPPPAAQGEPGKTPQWPVTVPDAQKSAQPAPPEPGWTAAEIAEAQAQCTAILAKHKATATALAPLREGDCGTPYPVEVTAIAGVDLSQPAVMTCALIAGLSDWLRHDVQPAARRHLGGQVTKLEVMSSYSCRNAYGRKRTRLSEHGRANAVDIKGFVVDRARGVDLQAHWGLTERDIKARIAAAEAQARAHAAAKAKAEAEARAVAEAQAKARAAAAGRPAASPADPTGRNPGDRDVGALSASGLAVLRGMVPGAAGRSDDAPEAGSGASTLTLGQPSRLGGPKAKGEAGTAATPPPASVPVGPATVPQAPAQVAGEQPSGSQAFLRHLHAAACKRFGTVLGPEANEAHRNHLHLDMADRGGRGAYCE